VSEAKPEDDFLKANTLLEIDRRGVDRYPCLRRPAVRVLARPSFQSYHALVREVAFRSIGLLLEKPFEAGTVLAIQMRSRHTGFSGILSAQVQHTTQQADGTWLLGCTLSRSLTDDEIFQLL
jgi:hypothetical protein